MRKSLLGLSSLASIVVFLFYLPVLNNDFVNWDDKALIVDNPFIRGFNPASFHWMFTNRDPDWMPLTWLSLGLDFQLGGGDPWMFHLTNVILHCANVFLVFWLCFRVMEAAQGMKIPDDGMGPRRWVFASLLTALLFGLHPIHVESVAWAVEMKDVLYSFFYLLGILLYLRWSLAVEKKASDKRLVFLCFLFSLMAKPMAVTFPIILLILDHWPLRKPLSWASLREKAVLLALALVFNLVTLGSHSRYIFDAGNSLDPFVRLNPFRSIFFYMFKMAVPVHLSPLYPFPNKQDVLYDLSNVLALTGVLGLSYAFFHFRKRVPALSVAWACYLVVLSPVLGFIQAGSQAAADRYTYVASVAFFLPIAVFFSGVLLRRAVAGYLAVVLLAGSLGWASMEQIKVWHDSRSLWSRVISVYPDRSALPYTNLAIAYLKAGDKQGAWEQFEKAVSITPPYAQTFNARGAFLLNEGRLDEAIQDFKFAVSLNPQYAVAHRNLAIAYERKGMRTEALMEAEAADNSEARAY